MSKLVGPPNDVPTPRMIPSRRQFIITFGTLVAGASLTPRVRGWLASPLPREAARGRMWLDVGAQHAESEFSLVSRRNGDVIEFLVADPRDRVLVMDVAVPFTTGLTAIGYAQFRLPHMTEWIGSRAETLVYTTGTVRIEWPGAFVTV